MTIKTQCPHCGQHCEQEDEYAGMAVECSACHRGFIIVKSSPQPPASATATSSASPRECPFCKAEVSGGALKCAHCGRWLGSKYVMTPKEKIETVLGAIIIVAIISAVIWGLVSCASSCQRCNNDAIFNSTDAIVTGQMGIGELLPFPERAKFSESQISKAHTLPQGMMQRGITPDNVYIVTGVVDFPNGNGLTATRRYSAYVEFSPMKGYRILSKALDY